MCETYNERGIYNIGLLDLGTGGWNFLSVALLGTIIGLYSILFFSYLTHNNRKSMQENCERRMKNFSLRS